MDARASVRDCNQLTMVECGKILCLSVLSLLCSGKPSKVHQDARFDLLDETDAVCCIPRNHEFQLLLMLLQLPQPKGLLDDATRILLSRPREHSLALL